MDNVDAVGRPDFEPYKNEQVAIAKFYDEKAKEIAQDPKILLNKVAELTGVDELKTLEASERPKENDPQEVLSKRLIIKDESNGFTFEYNFVEGSKKEGGSDTDNLGPDVPSVNTLTHEQFVKFSDIMHTVNDKFIESVEAPEDNPVESPPMTKEDQADKQPIKKPLVDRMMRKVFVESPERTTEFLSAQVMMGLEIMHDMDLYPSKYNLTPGQVGALPDPNTNPAAAWAIDHIGDIWEISAGFTAMRLGFVAVNEALKKEPIKKLLGGEYQVSDEAAFWASLMTTWTVKAGHSLGYYSLFGIHDHMANPVPGMIFGQGVAAVVLAASHYAAKYREPIKDLALRVGTKVIEGARAFDKKMNSLSRPDITPNIAVNPNDQNKE